MFQLCASCKEVRLILYRSLVSVNVVSAHIAPEVRPDQRPDIVNSLQLVIATSRTHECVRLSFRCRNECLR